MRGAPGLADFEGAVLTAPDVAALREKVHLHVDPACDAAFPRDYGASVSVTGAQGAVQVADCPQAWGDPENPMSEAEIVTKFRANIRHGSVPEAAASPLVDALLDLPDAPDLTHLKEALTAALSPAPEYA